MREPTEMELRVAEALWRKHLRHTRDPSGVHGTFASALRAHPWLNNFIDTARAAIRAMREPTPDMSERGGLHLVNSGYDRTDPSGVAFYTFRHMVDRASPPDSGEG